MKLLLLTQEGGHLLTKMVTNIISDGWMALCTIYLMGKGREEVEIPYEVNTLVGLQGCSTFPLTLATSVTAPICTGF